MRILSVHLFLLMIALILFASGQAEAFEKRVVRIDWGLKTISNQVWDGSVSVSDGRIVAIPFPVYSQSEFGKYNQRVSKISWKMLTSTKNGGLYLLSDCPRDAVISIDNAEFPFSFTLSDLDGKDNFTLRDGNITITDRTGYYIFARTGKEAGVYGEGTAIIEPVTATMNTLGTWKLTFTVGENGIPVGGGIRVSHHQSRSWGVPQFDDPSAENYVSVTSTNRDAGLDTGLENVEGCFDWPYSQLIALIQIKNAPLNPGDIVTLTLGDKSGGSPGFRAARTNETYTDFRVEVCNRLNGDYFPIYRVIRDYPRVEIHPGPAEKAFIVAPSIVTPGESFDMTLRMEDAVRNVASGYNGSLELYLDGKRLDRTVRVSSDDKGLLVIDDMSLNKAGIHQFTVRDAITGVAGVSNPVWCRENPKRRLYWGEMHCHSFYSDGHSTKDELFSFLRDVALLDFAAITDHDVEADSQDNTVLEMWRATQHTSALFHEPGKFVTFPAWEWSPHRYAINGDHFYGDHNVFYEKEDPARILLDASTAEYNTTDKLYDGLDTLGDRAIVIPHVGGSVGQWDIHSDKWQPLGEIYSVHGSFEGWGRLGIGRYKRKVGFIGSGDNHNGQGGAFPPSGVRGHSMHGGLAAVFAEELDRSSLLSAMFERRVYATSGPRILIDFSINGNPIGSEISLEKAPELSVLAHGEAPIWKADVVKDGEVVHSWVNKGRKSADTITILWCNWIKEDGYDRNYGSGGIPRMNWNGGVTVEGAEIEDFTPRSFHLLNDEITASGPNSVEWNSQTRGDWDGMTVKLSNAGRNTSLHFRTGDADFTIKPRDLKKTATVILKNETTEVVVIRGALDNETVSFKFKDKKIEGDSYYYVRVTQIDGEEAWASPIFINGK